MQLIEKSKKTSKTMDLALQEDLERRYGPAMAQEILDQLKKAEDRDNKASPDYFSVKALSEAEEIYRREAQTALQRLKIWKRNCGIAKKDVVELEGAFLAKEFDRSFEFYIRFHKGYHVLYRQAMHAYKVRAFVPYKEIRTDEAEQNTTMNMAA